MSHSYPSDISREQFVRILPTLESARRRTKPRTVDLYDVFCGVLYLLKSGCQWRMLPADFPNWRTCYKYFRQWSERPGPGQDSILEQVPKKNRLARPDKAMDGKSRPASVSWTPRASKNTDTAEHKGYDAGKKVSGIKRHIASCKSVSHGSAHLLVSNWRMVRNGGTPGSVNTSSIPSISNGSTLSGSDAARR